MHVELIGCSSAGKTTLAIEILESGRQQGLDILLGDEFVLQQFGLHWIKSALGRKLLVNLAGLLASAVTWRKNRNFYAFATKVLFQLPIAPLERLSLLRNVLKKLGVSEIIRSRSTSQQVVVLDEGALQIAHNLFVHVSSMPTPDAITAFLKFISLPDVVLYIWQPEPTLVERITRRGHARIADPTHEKVVSFVRSAVTTFDTLAQEPAVRKKLLLVHDGQRGSTPANEQEEPFLAAVLKIVRPVAEPYGA